MVCSKSITNFEFPRITYIRLFVALCWYSYSSSSAILNVQLIFDSYFDWTCFGSSSIFVYSKKWIKEPVSNFQGGAVKEEYYLQVMGNLPKAILQKLRDLWKNRNWHHDNAPAHTSLLVLEFSAKNNTIMLPQPPYSPDLAPVTFSCSRNWKGKNRRWAKTHPSKMAVKN